MTNENLNTAKTVKNDEFYTHISDIEKELSHYVNYFAGKTIYLNCDNPEHSNFWKYFCLHFDEFELKKLIATYYAAGVTSYKHETSRFGNNKHKTTKTKLSGDGDFRSTECAKLLREADIVITNPPFSLWREYIAKLIEYDKKFIILGSQNVVKYKEVFPLFQENKIWVGFNYGSMTFTVPKTYDKQKILAEDGTYQTKLGNICWFTNLDIDKRHKEKELSKKYQGSEKQYPAYDNYNAIDVGKIKDIPCDYYGKMGVPITFINDYSPEQFKIIGCMNLPETLPELKPLGKEWVDKYFSQGGRGHVSPNMMSLCFYTNDGIAKRPYDRIIIQRIDEQKSTR